MPRLKRSTRPTAIATLAMVVMALAFPFSALAAGPEAPVMLLGSFESASLVRGPNGISMTLKASGLNPGSAVSVWWVVDNDPTDGIFADGICSAAGHIVGNAGTLNAGSHLANHEPSESLCTAMELSPPAMPVMLEGPALTNPEGAIVYLILIDHGQKLTGQDLVAQLNFPDQGCNPGCAEVGMAIFAPMP
jgi:hypothetical protein